MKQVNVDKKLTEMQKLHLDTTLRVMEMVDVLHFESGGHPNLQLFREYVAVAAAIIGCVEEYGDPK
jgi:hypothetical protein